MIEYRRGDTSFVVAVVSIAHFFSHVFLLAYPPLFPLLAAEFSVTTAQLGLLVTAIYVPQLLFQLPLGEVVDRVGAKWILVSGLVVTSLSIGGSGLATSYWMLLAFAFVSGIGQSVFHPADYALLETVTTAENEGKGFSAHTFGGYAGFAAAPLVIGSIGITLGWQIALVTVGVVGFIVAIAISLTTESVHARRIESISGRADRTGRTLRQMVTFVKQRDLLFVFGFYLVSMMALVGLQSFTTVLAVYGYGFTESAANTLLTVHLTCTAIGVVVGGPLADRASFRWIVVWMFVLSAVGVGGLVVSAPGASFTFALLLLAIIGFLFGLALPSRDKFANSVVDPDAVGTSFGFFFTGLSLGAVVSPALLGVIIDLWTAPIAFVVVGLLLLVAALIVVVATYTTAQT
ncbi:MFS family permease [Halalkaliarchaeum sp. AArc-CO]|uniref:MFS transporter n=1 Tax=Halalkaliarchaeum sp. AArc-CO TaxID=2866381 RepID=UPI00217D3C3F|nr:MFS transporter [Halalkaliarchaeum sp. AArc-CO]UWG51756.1 MFS family permease [Halalkaliarchaeum sp. AArc-CO]